MSSQTTSGAQIALIICTRNRADRLRHCLDQVARLRFPSDEWELVLVDNGSTDETADVIRSFVGSQELRVIHVTEPNIGQGRARNLGIANAQAPILAFTDDDCYPAPDFLDRVLEVFQDQTLGYIGGRVLLFDPSDAPITIREDREPYRFAPQAVVEPGVIQGANMALRRVVLDEVGVFDPELGPGTPFICDDVDLCARASAAGWSGGFFPGPVVHHHHGRKPGPTARRQLKTYDYGRGAYFAKFALRGDTRARYLAAWARRLAAFYRQGPGFSSRVRELAGAVRYLRRRSQVAASESAANQPHVE